MFETDRYTDEEIDLWGTWSDDPEDAPAALTSRAWDTYYSRQNPYQLGAFTNSLSAERVAASHRVIKSFVDTFSRADEHYNVTFGGGKATYTDRDAKEIRITHDPLYDKSLTDEQAARVLVGFACHEASHSRYGADHEQRMRRVFGKDARSAHTLANLLDDRYIERAFQAEYPGWTGVFNEAIKWAAAENPSTDPVASPLLMGVRAVRYADSYDWTGHEDVLAWWENWATTYAVTDPKVFTDGVRVALEYIAEQREQKPDLPQPQQAPQQQSGEPGGYEGDSSVQEDAPEGTEQEQPEQAQGGQQAEDDAEGGDQQDQQQAGDAGKGDRNRDLAAKADQANTEADLEEAYRLSEMTTAGDDPALGDTTREYRDKQTNDAFRDMETLEPGSKGSLVEHLHVARLPRKNLRGRDNREIVVETSGSAAAAIRNAFARSRGGHTEITRGTTRGRCDNGSLYRIAQGDNRLFHRRSSPSPDNWLVWVLVDWSSSMSFSCSETLSAARALAAASRSVPEMRLSVKTWTSPQASQLAQAGVVELWNTGDSLARFNDAGRIQMGGTPDATVMGWARKAILREARGSERTMIVFLSDGEGQQYALATEVEAARKAGTEVISMALDNLDTQLQTYGAKRAIPYKGSITAAAGPLARMLTRVMR